MVVGRIQGRIPAHNVQGCATASLYTTPIPPAQVRPSRRVRWFATLHEATVQPLCSLRFIAYCDWADSCRDDADGVGRRDILASLWSYCTAMAARAADLANAAFSFFTIVHYVSFVGILGWIDCEQVLDIGHAYDVRIVF